MKTFRNSLIVGCLALLPTACGAPEETTEAQEFGQTNAPLIIGNGDIIKDQYIVAVKDGSDPTSVAAIAGVSPKYVYTAAFNGFAAVLNDGQLRALRANPAVAYVEADARVSADATQSSATWGIDRTDQRALPLSGTYNYTATAGTVRAYVIDTGLQANHPQFGTRASNVYDAFGGSGADCNGHGTHVGGTIGGSTYGIAKGALLRGVRVLDCNGSGSNSGIIAGMDWVRVNHVKPAVANMSLGGGYSSSVNTAATNLANAGVFVAVAAGNSNADACNYSPASASGVTTVAASTSSDARASYSNYGSCVELYAPGSSITSAWINSGTNTISGTSMASPHVAGVAALYKATYGDAASSTINSWLINNSTASVITSNVGSTPNRLLFKSSL
ncbi:MAG TPA: S8 family peptidase [Myxococcaceae bacterium]|nr:S8 family peptidase [Myxococcaceae bacterium]